jgi:hypothetical protein
VIQSLVSIFVESSLGASRKDTDSAKTFLNEQIKQYEAKLEEAEARVKEFRCATSTCRSRTARTPPRVANEPQLEQAKLNCARPKRPRRRQAAAGGREGPGNQLALPNLLQESSISVATPEIDARIDAQKRNLDACCSATPTSTPMSSPRALMKDLEEQKRKEVAELRKARWPAGTCHRSASQQPGVAGTEPHAGHLRSPGRALKARVDEYTARYAAARASLKTAPQIEAEAAQLNRDYAIIKKNYEDLVARKQSAVMSGELDVASGVADFRLIDPPARLAQAGVAQPTAAAAAGPGGRHWPPASPLRSSPANCARSSAMPTNCVPRPACRCWASSRCSLATMSSAGAEREA